MFFFPPPAFYWLKWVLENTLLLPKLSLFIKKKPKKIGL
jgi:hypothetical protein